MSKAKLTISLDHAVVEKLPAKNKSAAIEAILRSHYQYGGKEQLYEYIKKRLQEEYELKQPGGTEYVYKQF